MTLKQALAEDFSEELAGLLWEGMRGKDPWKMSRVEFCLLLQMSDSEAIAATPAEFNSLLSHHGISAVA